MSECFYCLTKADAVFMTLLPVVIVTAWFLIERWIRK